MNNNPSEKTRAPRNRTVTLVSNEIERYSQDLVKLSDKTKIADVLNRTINQSIFEIVDFLPAKSVDLMIVDPPYNLTKDFNGNKFAKKTLSGYEEWLDTWLCKLAKLLKETGSIYICGDWQSSSAIHRVAERYFHIRNRITWEREKGRGAKTNWKNCSEDIWFCTKSNTYCFNLDSVKVKRKVLAPYTDNNGDPKDWTDNSSGKFRITHPSNLWNDITIPFWSMSENTDHPTQKPEKLVAKLILASSKPGDIVFDPFLGSGTTSVVAKKLGRKYIGVEVDKEYCCLSEKRLEIADRENSIQGYDGGYFWERNTLADQKRTNGRKRPDSNELQRSLL